MNHAKPPVGNYNGERVSTGTPSRPQTIIAWAVSIIGAAFPGVFPVAFFGFMVACWTDGPLSTPSAVVGQRVIIIFACIGGPLLGASPGALIGLRHGSQFEWALRQIILCGGAGILSGLLLIYLQGGLDDFIALILVPIWLLACAGIIGNKSISRLCKLLAIATLAVIVLGWVLYPFLPDPLLAKAECALQVVSERAVQDPVLDLETHSLNNGGHPNVYPGFVSLNIHRPRKQPRGGPSSNRPITVIITRHASQLNNMFSYFQAADRFLKHTEWTAENQRLFIQVQSLSDNPQAHGRLLTIVREELRSEGIEIDQEMIDTEAEPNAEQAMAIAMTKKHQFSSFEVDLNDPSQPVVGLNISFPTTRALDLAHLDRLTNLKRLHLSGPGVTDAGLAHLDRFTELQILYLGNTRVTDIGLEKLRKALPNCHITHSPIRATQ